MVYYYLLRFVLEVSYHAGNQDIALGVMSDGCRQVRLPWLRAERKHKHINPGLTGFIYQWRQCIRWDVMLGEFHRCHTILHLLFIVTFI